MTERKSPLNALNLSNLAGALLFLVSPLLFSGDWTWRHGWIFTCTMLVGTLVSRFIGNRAHPGLARERLTGGILEDVKAWDKWIVSLYAVWLPVIAGGIAGLDRRLGWSPGLPAWVHWSGLALVAVGFAAGTWAMAVNQFFSLYNRIQKERGHHVVTNGPYAIVRHPGYAASALSMAGIPLMLDSLTAFLPVILIYVLGIIRTALEDKMLLKELPGYREYAAKVRYRLIPGIW